MRDASAAKLTILWITAGLGCDGESVALTAATQPSIEDIVMGGMPGLPEIHLLNPFYSYENGDEYIHYLELAAEGKLEPFILVVEGSVPDETNKAEGYWAALGTDKSTGEPILTCDWIDRLAPKAWAVMAVGNLRGVRRRSRDGRQSYRSDGLARLSRLGLEIEGRRAYRLCSGLPDPAGQYYGNSFISYLPIRRTFADDPAR